MRDSSHIDNLEVVANQKIKEKNYWLKKLSGQWVKSTFPYSFEKGEKQTHPGEDFHIKTFRFSGELFSAFMKLSTHKDIKLSFILIAGLVVVVNRYNTFTGKDDITIGAPIYKQDIDGEFVNTVLVLRNRLQDSMTFKELLLEVRQTIIEANDNCNYPVEVLAKQLGMSYSPGDDFPLFDIVFLLENIQDRTYIQHINCNIRFLFKRAEEYIEGVLEYNPLLYDKRAIEKIINHFTAIFQNVLFNVDMEISGIDILSGGEKRQILEDFNAAPTGYPRDKAVHELFEEQVERRFDGVAIVGKREKVGEIVQMTYGELNKRSGQLACVLRENGVVPDTIVGLMLEQSLEMIVGIVGILKAGGAYLPIDPYYPRERIEYMLKDSNALLLLTSEELADVGSVGKGTRFCAPTTCNRHQSLAYVTYTSGSTGRPKGVMVEHRNVVRLVKNTNYFQFREGDRLLQTGAVEFDASTFEIWGSLLNGLSLYFIPKDEILAAEQVGEIIGKYDIGIMWLTSPLFNQLSAVDIEIFKGLRTLLVGGDVLSPVHIERVRSRFPQLNIINGYGPTENATFSTTFLITGEYKERIPIGKPIANSTAYIVNEDGGLVPVGVPGELWVGGDGVSRGYLNNPELTYRSYRTYRTYSSKRIYKTGDLARWLPDGNIDFMGRIDGQVKIRGFRIELGEIENRLMGIEGISEAVVIAGKDHTNQKYLCAYIVSESEINPPEINGTLAQTLPAYMIPAYVMQVDHIPLTPNGKVDFRALPVPGIGLKASADYAAPGNEIEEKMVEIWAQILGIDKKVIGVKDNFFERGGDSLKATILAAKIHKVFNARIPLDEIFMSPTPAGICSLISVTNWAREKDREIDTPSDSEDEEIVL